MNLRETDCQMCQRQRNHEKERIYQVFMLVYVHVCARVSMRVCLRMRGRVYVPS